MSEQFTLLIYKYIESIFFSGRYKVLFDDGFEQWCKLIHLKASSRGTINIIFNLCLLCKTKNIYTSGFNSGN